MENYIFDLYGTLIDIKTDEHCAHTWKKWCKLLDHHNIKHPEYFIFRRDFFELDKKNRITLKEQLHCQVPEIDIIEVYRELFLRYGNEALEDAQLYELAYAFRVASREYIRLYPGVIDYLTALRAAGKHTYILSNAQRSYTWPEIQMFDLDKLTDDQLISSDYQTMKPDTAFFDALINKHNLTRSESLMHGDSYSSDIAGAISACIKYVHLVDENHPSKYYLKQLELLKS